MNERSVRNQKTNILVTLCALLLALFVRFLSIKLVALFEILPFKSFKYVCFDRRINRLSTSYSLRGLAIVGRYFSEAVALSAGPLNILIPWKFCRNTNSRIDFRKR